MIMIACGSDSDYSADDMTVDTDETIALTVEINTETLAPEQQEQVSAVADSLTGELENKTIKWMSFYDPWHAGTNGNTKPVSVELFETKYGGEIEYYPTTWDKRFDDISTSILGGEGIDFIAGSDLDSFPKGVQSGMIESYDEYIDWSNPLWASVKELNDQFELGGSHYVMGTHASNGYVVYYNRETIESNGFDDPAELLENGEWTLEKFKDMLMEFVDEDNEQYGLDGWFYEIQQSPDIWTKTFGNAEDVMFVPIPRDEQADEYYLHAGLDAYMLCKGSQNPEGVARFMECIIASYSDESTKAINIDKMKNDYGWSDEMIEMESTIAEMTAEHPVCDLLNGIPTDASSIITSGDTGINAPLGGKE